MTDPSTEPAPTGGVPPDLLRRFPLFESLSDEQREWLAARGEVIAVPAGTRLFDEGEEPHGFFVLVEGEIELLKRIGTRERVSARGREPGLWAGAIPMVDPQYPVSARAPRDSRFFTTSEDVMRHMLATGFPIARHLLMGVRMGIERFQSQLQEHEKLTALGKMAAGLAHELNNPASAARRAAGELGRVLDDHEAAWETLARLPDDQWRHEIRRLSGHLGATAALALSPMERSDREDEVGGWLEEHGVAGAWELAPSLVDAGIGLAELDGVSTRVTDDAIEPVLRWASSRAAAGRLVREIDDGVDRISELVRAVKDYTYMDQGEVQDVDVHAGLDSTLRMLRHKLRGIDVERRYNADLPTVCARGSELNQVWTNLLDNAADALSGSGTISVSTRSEGDEVVVEVTDDGPGIPPEIQRRVFEPFFTTKAPGQGTGIGLDTAYRIVAQDHGGSISVASRPGQTTFTVRLPVRPPGLTVGDGSGAPGGRSEAAPRTADDGHADDA